MYDLKQFNIDNPLPPLWLMYPEISRGCIGWRMGYGEDYCHELHKWFKTLSTTELAHYRKLFPAPILWRGYYEEEEDSIDDFDLFFEYKDYFISFWRKKGTPLYSLDQIQSRYSKGEDLEFMFFFGHQIAKDGNLTHACLSQWWVTDFFEFIDTFCCMEQYMMAEKARLFNDEEILQQILESNSPKTIKALGKKVKNFVPTVWDEIKHTIILTGSYYKFSQNPSLRTFLLSSSNKILVEASPYDNIWGIQMDVNNKDITNPCKWQGQNMLGFALMEVRDDIKKVFENYNLIDWEKVRQVFKCST